jgi:hypothetical protein
LSVPVDGVKALATSAVGVSTVILRSPRRAALSIT